jgi:hypothetical protein
MLRKIGCGVAKKGNCWPELLVLSPWGSERSLLVSVHSHQGEREKNEYS